MMHIDFGISVTLSRHTKLWNQSQPQSQPSLRRPIDPSLYVHRFAARLDFRNRMHLVSATALQLIKSMKRDWIQTGRRPAGICGAALLIAAQVHGRFRTPKP